MSCTQVYGEPGIIDNENTNGKYPLWSFSLESLLSAMDENNCPQYIETISTEDFYEGELG